MFTMTGISRYWNHSVSQQQYRAGCTFASSIASQLLLGKSPPQQFNFLRILFAGAICALRSIWGGSIWEIIKLKTSYLSFHHSSVCRFGNFENPYVTGFDLADVFFYFDTLLDTRGSHCRGFQAFLLIWLLAILNGCSFSLICHAFAGLLAGLKVRVAILV